MSESSELLPKPQYWTSEYATWFRDPSIVSVYHYRPPYPSQVFDVLRSLIIDVPRTVLDVGCGTGDICRVLAPSVDRIDAIDFSVPMIAKGKQLPGGNGANVVWIEGSVENAALTPPYALITAGESIHWMEWDVVLPRFASALSEHGMLAVIERNWDGPRESEVRKRIVPIFRQYAAKEMNAPFNLISGLAQRGFQKVGELIVCEPWQPTVTEYIECRHAQNSFSRDQMGEERAAAFDTDLGAALEALCEDGSISIRDDRLMLEVRATVIWGRITSPAESRE